MSSLLKLSVLMLTALIVGCATLPRDPVPVDKAEEAVVPGMPEVRSWAGVTTEAFQKDVKNSVIDEPKDHFQRNASGEPIYDVLALSGGGANGAFGAGFVYGWSENGDRPKFKLITGISTGALIAPFVFAGPEYDEVLKELYTGVSTEDIVESFSVFQILFKKESLSGTAPLYNLISNYVTQDFLADVAKAHDQGSRLFIGTTNLDAGKLVVWNMGLIAKSGHPDAAELFRKVMLASASIPIAFPPVMIPVEVDGQLYDEMHVDGGTNSQVFFHAMTININKITKKLKTRIPSFEGTLYIVRNGKLASEQTHVERKLLSITDKTVSVMIKSAARNDLFRMKLLADAETMDVRFVGIPEDFVSESEEEFDQKEMGRLFEIGRTQWKQDDPWLHWDKANRQFEK